MKTIEEVKNEIDGNMEYLERLHEKISKGVKTSREVKMHQRDFNRVIKENAILREILMYLQTNPKEEFIISEREKVQKVLASKNFQFTFWVRNCCPDDLPVNKRRSVYNKEQGITILQHQLKTLNLILNIH